VLTDAAEGVEGIQVNCVNSRHLVVTIGNTAVDSRIQSRVVI
jgi:hypothetical protein